MIKKQSLRTSLAMLLCIGGCFSSCSKARGDDYSRFKPKQSLESPGSAPRQLLRYNPTSAQDLVYQLEARRDCAALRSVGKMRFRVGLLFPGSTGPGGQFKLRLLTLLRMDPPPPQTALDLGPGHVLLSGMLAPRGALSDLQDSDVLTPPVNLRLLAPLLFPEYPKAAIGVGAKWKSSRHYAWKRSRVADQMVNQPGFEGTTDVLLHRSYHFEKISTVGDAKRAVIVATVTAKLRNKTVALAHKTEHTGTMKTTNVRYEVDLATGIPSAVSVQLVGQYRLRANDQTKPITETISITLAREQ